MVQGREESSPQYVFRPAARSRSTNGFAGERLLYVSIGQFPIATLLAICLRRLER